MAPSGVPSLTISGLPSATSRGPSSRNPIRFDSSLTTNLPRASIPCASSGNQSACGPRVTRNVFFGFNSSKIPVRNFLRRIFFSSLPIGNVSPFRSAHPPPPPQHAQKSPDGLPPKFPSLHSPPPPQKTHS